MWAGARTTVGRHSISAADLTTMTQPELKAIAARLNDRPRQTLNWMTPTVRLKSFRVAVAT